MTIHSVCLPEGVDVDQFLNDPTSLDLTPTDLDMLLASLDMDDENFEDINDDEADEFAYCSKRKVNWES
jgi:hypothetical protein